VIKIEIPDCGVQDVIEGADLLIYWGSKLNLWHGRRAGRLDFEAFDLVTGSRGSNLCRKSESGDRNGNGAGKWKGNDRAPSHKRLVAKSSSLRDHRLVHHLALLRVHSTKNILGNDSVGELVKVEYATVASESQYSV
jgi:hypothetical protein